MKQNYWTYNKPLSMTGFGGGAASLFVAKASSATDLASFFGVDPSTSTTIRFRSLDCRFDCGASEPANGWASFPTATIDSGGDSSRGVLVGMLGITATDNAGMWNGGNQYGYALGGTQGYPYDTVICNSSSFNTTAGVWYEGGSGNVTNNNSSNYLYTTRSIAHAHTSSNDAWIDFTFNSGLGTSKGFVIQHYGPYTNQFAENHSPICQMSCNSVSAIFAPKGDYIINSNTSATNNFSTNGGHIAYPTIYNHTTATAIASDFIGLSGSTLPSNYFVY